LLNAGAQTPVALPNTMTTLAGLSPAPGSSGSACWTGSAYKTTDAYGDGCPAVNAVFGASGRGGVAVDFAGNVIVADDINNIVHLIDPNTGIVTKLAGLGSVCTGKLDKDGDGCLAATQSILASPRGIGIDPYGNVLVADYSSSDSLVHVICRAASPLCTAAQVGYMELAAGCVSGTTATGTAGVGLDNKPGVSTGTTCTTSLGEVDAPRGATADLYGNVYYADTNSSRTRVVLGPLTSSYFSGNNPLYAALQTHWTSPKAGYVYAVVNIAGTGTGTGGTATTAGNTCTDATTAISGKATDIRGDGCPYSLSSVDAASGYTNTVAVDAAGNMIFTDPGNGSAIYGGLRVLYVSGLGTAGSLMKAAIIANNSGVTPQVGFIYSLAGGSGMQTSPSGLALSTAPTLGNSTEISDSTITKVTVSPQGNIYIGDGTKVLFYDIYTGTIRKLLVSGSAVTLGHYCSGSTGQISLSAYSDGCPAADANFGNSNGLGVAVDGQGNLYMYDAASNTTGMLVREVLAQGMGVQPQATQAALSYMAGLTTPTAYPAQAMGTARTQTIWAHFPVATAAAATLTTSTTANMSYKAPSCTWYSSVDNSADCTVTVTDTPTAAGAQSASMTLVASGGETATIDLGSTVSGSVLAADGATSAGISMLTSSSLLSGYAPAALAVDGAGNVYEASGTNILESLAASPSTTQTLASGLSATPAQIAVDQTGNIFYLNGSSSIQELAVSNAGAGSAATYAETTLAYTPASLGTAHPVAIAVDQAGNLLVADEQNSASTIYKLSPAAVAANTQSTCSYPATASTAVLPTLCQSTVYNAGAFGTVSAMVVDPSGNIYVADTTHSAVYELTPSIVNGIYTYAESTKASASVNALAVDPAGDLYVQTASTTAGVTMYPVSGPTSAGVTVLGAVTTPVGLAVDGVGNVYSADASNSSVTKVMRNSVTENFGSSYTTEFAATLTNVGNQTSTAQSAANGAGASAFTLSAGSANGCVFNNDLLSAMTAGETCTMTAYFPAIGSTQDTDNIEFTPTSPAISTVGILQLTGLANQEGYDTTTVIGAASTSSPVFAPSGTEVSFPITVTASSTSTDGSVTDNTTGPTTSNYVYISIDSGTNTVYNFTSASGLSAYLTLNLSALTKGSHTFTVTFPQQASLLPSNATSGTINILQAGTTISWSPSATTQQVSAALGAGVLDATVTPSIAGNFIYSTAGAQSCTSAATATVDASTYLAIGSYTLYATFCPADSTDYASSSASISYTVTQATTTAAVGASVNVLASDGTGNYTSLTAALEALPATGGTIYIKPGTYSGQNVISYPNVQLRGLGGDPTQVILTGENGDFSTSTFTTSTLPTGFSFGPANKGSNEGSATLDVSKNAYMGTAALSATYTPNNFYAEYLTIQNTYDTDPTTKSTWTATSNGGTCSSGGAAIALQTLYNNNQLCGSQATALFMNSDQAVLNNVNLLGQQDTLYASGIGCGTYCTVARQYLWQGLIVGDVDYVFGDAALVFDHTNFFTTWHGLTATGNETIEAQNKRYPTGTTSTTNSSYSTSSDYLSGFICNSCNLMSQSTGMTKLYYGRPYNISSSNYPSSYSTWVMLNSYVDQVNPAGWIGWDGASQYLNTSTYAEYNTQTYTDPSPGAYPYPASIFNSSPPILYSVDSGNATSNSLLPAGGNNGSYGVLATSTTPANRESYALQLTAAEAAPYYPVDFLSTAVPSTKLSPGDSSTWNPVYALAARVNGFVPVSSVGAITLGGSVTILGRPQTPGAGVVPTGSYAFYDSIGSNQVCTAASSNCVALAAGPLDASGEAYLITSSLASGTHYITMVYGGDTNFAGSTSSTYSIYVLGAGQTGTTTALAVNDTSSTVGTAITGTVTVSPSNAPGIVSLYLDGVAATTCTLSSGSCSWSISGPAAGSHTLYASYPGNSSFGLSTSSNVTLEVVAPVATGDTRTVTEPSFPARCQQLTAALASNVSTQDLDTTVDATNTNIDGARIQAALNSCSALASSTNNLAVELSANSTGTFNAFLSGPLSMPSNVTLLVDPNVTLYFSRNAQDYDIVSGVHTCGTINAATSTKSCVPLIDIPGSSTNVGIMGYGKLNGRGGDALLNGFATSGYAVPSSYSWWNLALQADNEGNQQNPRFIQMDTGASGITLYKITILNSPMFHVSTTGAVKNFTAWDIKIVTPTSARNTDGIDPGNATNFTITRSWISDGDDNVAVGASGTSASNAASNITVTNNHFFAGHGESIGSYTGAGVSNVLFDGNMSVGNGWAGYGSATVTGVADGNSTAIRIKSANDRGGLVTGIQYSNSCFLDHKTDIQFTPYYSSGDSTTKFPSYTNILLQNLVFMNDDASNGTVELTGEYNSNSTGGTVVTNPLYVTLDNVTFPSTLSSLVNTTTPVESTSDWGTGNYSGGKGQYANFTVGAGTVSSNFLSALNALVAVSSNNDTLTNNIALSSLDPPACTFTYLAPELTGPNGLPQTIAYGTSATIDVILTPAVGGAAYPNGTVTLTDNLTGNAFTGTFNGTGDTLAVTIPASDLSVGTHTFSASSYSGDSNYTVPAFGSYAVTVIKATPTITWAAPADITYGTALSATQLNATASVAGTFGYTPAAGTVLAAGAQTLSVTFTPTNNTSYNTVVATVGLTVDKATPAVALGLSSGANPVVPGNPVTYTATVGFPAGVGTTLTGPTGTVTFYDGTTVITGCTGLSLGAYNSISGVSTSSCIITYSSATPATHSITASYSGDTNFAGKITGALVESVADFAITAQNAALTVTPGLPAIYTFTVAPQNSATTFPAAVSFTYSSVPALPAGWTVTFSPNPLAAGSGSSTITMTVDTALTASTMPNAAHGIHGTLASRLAPFTLAFLLLPFVGRMRKAGKRFHRMLPILLLLLAGIAAAAGLSGCGSNSGYFGQAPQNYSVTVTATAGALSHTSNVTLTVE
jgi:polygalacturonase/sugar lactone lactonase YvrE